MPGVWCIHLKCYKSTSVIMVTYLHSCIRGGSIVHKEINWKFVDPTVSLQPVIECRNNQLLSSGCCNIKHENHLKARTKWVPFKWFECLYCNNHCLTVDYYYSITKAKYWKSQKHLIISTVSSLPGVWSIHLKSLKALVQVMLIYMHSQEGLSRFVHKEINWNCACMPGFTI